MLIKFSGGFVHRVAEIRGVVSVDLFDIGFCQPIVCFGVVDVLCVIEKKQFPLSGRCASVGSCMFCWFSCSLCSFSVGLM